MGCSFRGELWADNWVQKLGLAAPPPRSPAHVPIKDRRTPPSSFRLCTTQSSPTSVGKKTPASSHRPRWEFKHAKSIGVPLRHPGFSGHPRRCGPAVPRGSSEPTLTVAPPPFFGEDTPDGEGAEHSAQQKGKGLGVPSGKDQPKFHEGLAGQSPS